MYFYSLSLPSFQNSLFIILREGWRERERLFVSSFSPWNHWNLFSLQFPLSLSSSPLREQFTFPPTAKTEFIIFYFILKFKRAVKKERESEVNQSWSILFRMKLEPREGRRNKDGKRREWEWDQSVTHWKAQNENVANYAIWIQFFPINNREWTQITVTPLSPLTFPSFFSVSFHSVHHHHHHLEKVPFQEYGKKLCLLNSTFKITLNLSLSPSSWFHVILSRVVYREESM